MSVRWSPIVLSNFRKAQASTSASSSSESFDARDELRKARGRVRRAAKKRRAKR